MLYTIALDPGKKTGFAVFHNTALMEAGTWKDRLEDKFKDICIELLKRTMSQTVGNIEVVIEEPGTRGWSDRQRAVRSLNQRVGIFTGIAITLEIPAFPVPVSTWKGNKPKSETECAMARIYGPVLGEGTLMLDSNAWDAIGIGHYWISNRSIREASRKARMPKRCKSTER